MLGIFMHGVGANLKLDNSFIWCNDSGMKRLIAVLLRHSDIIFNTTGHRGIEGVDETKCEIAVGDILYDDAEGSKVVDFIDVLVVFSEFAMQGID